MESEFEQITTELADGVFTITLNRPDRLNAWTGTMGASCTRRSTRPTPTTTCAR